MIPFLSASPPTSAKSLAAAIRDGLALYDLKAHEIRVDGDSFPKLDSIVIDLSGARMSTKLKIARSKGAGPGHIEAGSVELLATPLLIETLPVEFRITAKDVCLLEPKSAGAGSFLTLERATEGRLEMRAAIADLEAFLHAKASEAAGKQGADLRETHLTVSTRGESAISFRAEVLAKMFLLKANVVLSGDVDIDDALDLRISHLEIGGNAMAAGLLSKIARPQMDALQSKPIPLRAFALGDVKLRNVKIACDDAIRITAEFGSERKQPS